MAKNMKKLMPLVHYLKVYYKHVNDLNDIVNICNTIDYFNIMIKLP